MLPEHHYSDKDLYRLTCASSWLPVIRPACSSGPLVLLSFAAQTASLIKKKSDNELSSIKPHLICIRSHHLFLLRCSSTLTAEKKKKTSNWKWDSKRRPKGREWSQQALHSKIRCMQSWWNYESRSCILLCTPSQFVFRDLSCFAHTRANSVSDTESLFWCILYQPQNDPYFLLSIVHTKCHINKDFYLSSAQCWSQSCFVESAVGKV